MIQYGELSEVVRLGLDRFKYDERYSLSALADAFACRSGPEEDDTALLERICAAYIKAAEYERSAAGPFAATPWWQQTRRKHLTPVMEALRGRNIEALRHMYRNFFRNPCSTNLVGLPVDMQRCYFSGEIDPLYGRFFLGDALHRLDLWKAVTKGRFPIAALRSPAVGNPYGITVDGVFIRIAAESQHFYAQELARLLGDSNPGTVLEIGGGFGGMAGYLIRDTPRLTYLNFDVPETIALASYYLLRSFPSLTATLYGEADITPDVLHRSDIILMPTWQIAAVPDSSVNVSFSSHVLGDLSPEAAHEYTAHLARVTRDHVLIVDRDHTDSDVPRTPFPAFNLARKRPAFWETAKSLRNNQAEWLYTACADSQRSQAASFRPTRSSTSPISFR
ncbi:MAG TPA: putative sugar O-methyltransferase [Bryobacteraceae bacterium]|nr:putative sugar O-methyltransferase [Bryobacteraceae bacterium]